MLLLFLAYSTDNFEDPSIVWSLALETLQHFIIVLYSRTSTSSTLFQGQEVNHQPETLHGSSLHDIRASLGLAYLLDSLLVLHSFPFEFLTCLSGVSKFSFVEVAAASCS